MTENHTEIERTVITNQLLISNSQHREVRHLLRIFMSVQTEMTKIIQEGTFINATKIHIY
jgi:hypothetical protein